MAASLFFGWPTRSIRVDGQTLVILSRDYFCSCSRTPRKSYKPFQPLKNVRNTKTSLCCVSCIMPGTCGKIFWISEVNVVPEAGVVSLPHTSFCSLGNTSDQAANPFKRRIVLALAAARNLRSGPSIHPHPAPTPATIPACARRSFSLSQPACCWPCHG